MNLITVVACLAVLPCTDNSDLALLMYLNVRHSTPCGYRSTGGLGTSAKYSFGNVAESTSQSGMSFMPSIE